jgi:hypothetical protein
MVSAKRLPSMEVDAMIYEGIRYARAFGEQSDSQAR